MSERDEDGRLPPRLRRRFMAWMAASYIVPLALAGLVAALLT
ncbi:MAG: hypothetical protein AAFU61_12605 [Pseudomonadota bacterium]